MNLFGIEAGWWSFGGQCSDVVGFILLTCDLYPEYRATKVRRLGRSFIMQVRQTIEDRVRHPEKLVPDILWPVLTKEKIDLKTAISQGTLLSMESRHRINGLTREQQAALRELEVRLGSLEFVHRNSTAAVDGSWSPNFGGGHSRIINDMIRLPPGVVVLAKRIGRLANKPLMWSSPEGLREADAQLTQLVEAVNNVTRMFDTASGSRVRFLIWPGALLIVLGFAAQGVGSLLTL